MIIAADSYAPAPGTAGVLTARPRWVTPSLVGLLLATAVLYLWGLGSAGWANDYYAAAAQAATQDLTAWLFGSLDSGSSITVDKPPAALWIMTLSARVFGLPTTSRKGISCGTATTG